LSARENRLCNHWAADHTNVPAGSTAILALDMYEHSYHLDFGADPKAYVTACMDNLHWGRIAERYIAAVHASTSSLALSAEAFARERGATLIDVRRKGAYEAGTHVIQGATWRDPERVDEWARELAGKEVVVYCVFGHEVGQSTAARLRDAGVSAQFLEGGIDQWKAAGRPLQPK
jgi:Fe-Mn family superoxide dismutase